jgi:hypothetical protein
VAAETAASYIRSVAPETFARLPSRMNIGTARMAKLKTPALACCTASAGVAVGSMRM